MRCSFECGDLKCILCSFLRGRRSARGVKRFFVAGRGGGGAFVSQCVGLQTAVVVESVHKRRKGRDVLFAGKTLLFEFRAGSALHTHQYQSAFGAQVTELSWTRTASWNLSKTEM